MKKFDNSNVPNRYNYREEDKKKKKSHNLLWILLLLCFLFVAGLTIILIGVTNSWFAFNQKMEGDFDFENGIVMTYEDIGVQSGTNFFLLKKDGNNFSTLNEASVSFGNSFILANPKLSAAEGSSNFFLRAKLEYSFTKIIDGNLATLDLQGLADELNKIDGNSYTKDNVLSAIFKNSISFNTSLLDGKDGWFYFANNLSSWTNTSKTPNYYDMQNSIVSSSTPKISIFKEENGQVKMDVIPGENNDMETFLVKSCKVTITINACETTEDAFSSWMVS